MGRVASPPADASTLGWASCVTTCTRSGHVVLSSANDGDDAAGDRAAAIGTVRASDRYGYRINDNAADDRTHTVATR